MKCVATLSKSTKGGVSVWNFFTPESGESQFTAQSGDGRDFKFYSVEKLRDYYRQMIDWGFTPVPDTGDDEWHLAP